MNNLFAKIFSYALEIVHILFIFFLSFWFFGYASDSLEVSDKILISMVALVFYILFIGSLTTLVSIREHLEEINEKISYGYDELE